MKMNLFQWIVAALNGGFGQVCPQCFASKRFFVPISWKYIDICRGQICPPAVREFLFFGYNQLKYIDIKAGTILSINKNNSLSY